MGMLTDVDAPPYQNILQRRLTPVPMEISINTLVYQDGMISLVCGCPIWSE